MIIFRGYKRAAADRSILIYMNRGLQEALKIEKKKRRRGKRLNLLSQKDNRPTFYSPIKVVAAREYQALKEDVEIAERQVIEERKAQRAINKQ